MARPRKLTDEQRLESNAARQKRWRDKNRVVEKLRSRNNRKKAKGVEEVQESQYVSIDEAEGWQPPPPIYRPMAQEKSVEKTEEEKSVEEKLARMMAGKKF